MNDSVNTQKRINERDADPENVKMNMLIEDQEENDGSLLSKVWIISKLGVPAIISIGMFFL